MATEINENKVTKVLYNQVSLAVALIATVLSVTAWVQNPQRDLEKEIIHLQAQVDTNAKLSAQLQNIKDNDLHTIEGNIKMLQENNGKLQEQLVEIKTILNERLPARK